MAICISWSDLSWVILIQIFDCVLGLRQKPLSTQHSAWSRSSWAWNFLSQHSSHLRKRSFSSSSSRFSLSSRIFFFLSTSFATFFDLRFFFSSPRSIVFAFSPFLTSILSQHGSPITSSGRFNCEKVSPLIAGFIRLVFLSGSRRTCRNIASNWRVISMFSMRILINAWYGLINWKIKKRKR